MARDRESEPKPRNPFLRRKDEWLRRCNSHPDLSNTAFKVLYFVADHASVREGGCSWFALPTIAAGTALSISTVSRLARNAVKCDLLRVNLRDGESSLFWPWLDGGPLTGTYDPDLREPRSNLTVVRDSATGRFTTVKNEMNPGQNRRGHSGQIRPTTYLSDLPNDLPKPVLAAERPASESSDVLPWTGLEKVYEKEIQQVAWITGKALTPRKRAQWAVELHGLIKIKNIDFWLHLVPAMQSIVAREEAKHPKKQITSLNYFEAAAGEWRDGIFEGSPISQDDQAQMRKWWDHWFARHRR